MKSAVIAPSVNFNDPVIAKTILANVEAFYCDLACCLSAIYLGCHTDDKTLDRTFVFLNADMNLIDIIHSDIENDITALCPDLTVAKPNATVNTLEMILNEHGDDLSMLSKGIIERELGEARIKAEIKSQKWFEKNQTWLDSSC